MICQYDHLTNTFRDMSLIPFPADNQISLLLSQSSSSDGFLLYFEKVLLTVELHISQNISKSLKAWIVPLLPSPAIQSHVGNYKDHLSLNCCHRSIC